MKYLKFTIYQSINTTDFGSGEEHAGLTTPNEKVSPLMDMAFPLITSGGR